MMIRTVVNLRRKSMRTILVLFAVLTFIVPAQAVVITCVSESGGAVRIDYDASDETVLPIAFALDVSVDGGAVITRVYDYKVGDSNAASPGFGIFPWSMQLDGTGKIINWGTPDVNSAGAGTQPGLGTSGVTLEMASRYKSAADAPHVKGTLCRILVDTRGASTVNVKVAPNINGGGVVLENAADAKFSSVGCILGSSAPPSQLPAPASISYPADSNTGRYTVSWPSSSGATSYQLERSANEGRQGRQGRKGREGRESRAAWIRIYSGKALSWSENVTDGRYSYRVRAINSAGSSSWRTGRDYCEVHIENRHENNENDEND